MKVSETAFEGLHLIGFPISALLEQVSKEQIASIVFDALPVAVDPSRGDAGCLNTEIPVPIPLVIIRWRGAFDTRQLRFDGWRLHEFSGADSVVSVTWRKE